MSTLKVNAIQDTSGNPKTPASAWVNFNGTGTVAIRASSNVSSITDSGTGDWTINFTAALADANYAVVGTADANGASGPLICARYPNIRNLKSTTQVAVFAMSYGGAANDSPEVNVAVFR